MSGKVYAAPLGDDGLNWQAVGKAHEDRRQYFDTPPTDPNEAA